MTDTKGTTSGHPASSAPRDIDYTCRTCKTNDHDYRDCDLAKQRLRCHRCGQRGHLRSSCPEKAPSSA
jgi:hypothetical protein